MFDSIQTNDILSSTNEGFIMHSVAVVVLEGVLMLDLAIPVQIFGSRSDTPYDVTLCGPSSHAVTAEGIPIELSGGIDAITAADTVIVPGREPFDRSVDGEVVAALAAAHRQSRRMVSIARERLETDDLTVDQVAHQCGLGTATNLRLHFRRALGTTPTAYRRAFSRRDEQRLVAEIAG